MKTRSRKKYTVKRRENFGPSRIPRLKRQEEKKCEQISGISHANFVPECEVLYEEGQDCDGLYKGCTKNPGHLDFIPVKDFKKKDLPPDCRTQAIMDFIHLMCNRTVKLTVKFTSNDRPDTYHDSKAPYPYWELKGSRRASRCATGFIRYVMDPPMEGKPCPCPICEQLNKPEMKYWEVVVITATHVVYDDTEASRTVIECFYDSADDKSNVKYLYGQRTNGDDMDMNYMSDRCQVTCVTHDSELVGRLRELQTQCRGKYNMLRALSCGVMISHPHGGAKKITVGNILHAKIPITPVFPSGEPHRFGKGTKYRQPLSSKIKDSDKSINESTSSQNKTNESCLNFEFPVEVEDGTTFTVPIDSQYLCQVHQHDNGFWVMFPCQTKFTLPNGDDLVVPSDTEFYCNKMNFYMTYQSMYYMTYDVPTCPGSSGAEVIHYDSMYTRSFLNHMGAQTIDGKGRSSLNICLR